VILKALPCGSVGQLGEVKVNPLSVPASSGSAWPEEVVGAPHLQGDGVYEAAALAQGEAVQANKPVRGGHQLGDQGDLGEQCSGGSRRLQSIGFSLA